MFLFILPSESPLPALEYMGVPALSFVRGARLGLLSLGHCVTHVGAWNNTLSIEVTEYKQYLRPQKSICFTDMFSQLTLRCRIRMWFEVKVK